MPQKGCLGKGEGVRAFEMVRGYLLIPPACTP